MTDDIIRNSMLLFYMREKEPDVGQNYRLPVPVPVPVPTHTEVPKQLRRSLIQPLLARSTMWCTSFTLTNLKYTYDTGGSLPAVTCC